LIRLGRWRRRPRGRRSGGRPLLRLGNGSLCGSL